MPTIKVGEVNIEYYVEGSGPPLLMIMGWIGHAGFWGEPFLEPLRQRFRTIRLSNRGTGLSDKPPGDVTIKTMADDAAGLLRELEIERAHVLGISMGGMIAQELVLNYPQAVRGLVLGCTMCGFAHGVSPETEELRGPSPATMTPNERVRQFLSAAATPEFLAKADSQFWQWVAATWFAAPTPWETIGKHFLAVQSFDTYDRLPQIKAPTLIVHGDRDLLLPVGNAEILRERIPDSRVRIVPDVAHMFFWEKPEESAAAIVEFLKSAVPA